MNPIRQLRQLQVQNDLRTRQNETDVSYLPYIGDYDPNTYSDDSITLKHFHHLLKLFFNRPQELPSPNRQRLEQVRHKDSCPSGSSYLRFTNNVSISTEDNSTANSLRIQFCCHGERGCSVKCNIIG